MKFHALWPWAPRLARVRRSKRYLKGLASYGRKVKTEARKARIIAELNAMGVKPRVRRKAISVWIAPFYILLLAFFLSSRAEASHGRYDVNVLSGVPRYRICYYSGGIPNLCLPRSPFDSLSPYGRNQDTIWPPFPPSSVPYSR